MADPAVRTLVAEEESRCGGRSDGSVTVGDCPRPLKGMSDVEPTLKPPGNSAKAQGGTARRRGSIESRAVC